VIGSSFLEHDSEPHDLSPEFDAETDAGLRNFRIGVKMLPED